ncbi:MAG: putative selenium-dependent hydroxylase accessory protein YqeC [Chloroflexi bacterium]|nr:putative selenium-dependent hydroxylase accessory protein YqeC [Chloroflexota bacterium]
MKLSRALRLQNPAAVSFAGAGGKTTAMFQLAREFPRTIVTATTHLGAWQIPLADHHIATNDLTTLAALENIPAHGVTLVSGEIENDRTSPVSENILSWLYEESQRQNTPLLIEADGARQKPLKAPAGHEPPIPNFTEAVIVTAGLSGLGKPLNDEHVHRAEIFSSLSGLQINQPITADSIARVLTHPQGGLKNIPPTARRIALLNQADTPELQSIGGGMTRKLLDHFDSVIVASLKNSNLQTFEQTAGIILAAGESTRFGSPKQLLDWKGKPFVRQVAETALQAGLWPVVAVTGFRAADIESALSGLPVKIVHNPEFPQGQSTSIRAGINSLPPPSLGVTSLKSERFGGGRVGAAVFLLADQPQIPADVIRALTESHTREMQSILAPLVQNDRRANPVLFDRITFPDLLNLTGDVGGRAIFDKHRVEYIPWHDDILLFDVDKPEDYQRLKEME